MNKKYFVLLFVFVLIGIFLSIAIQKQKVSLQIVKDIPLTGRANRLDYQSIDSTTNRLYISHLGSNMVHIFDLRKQKVIKDIPLTASPYGILAIPILKEVFVGVGGNSQVARIDGN